MCKLLPEGTAASPICFLDSEGLRLSKNRKSLRKSTERELHSFAGVSTVKFMVYAEAGRKGRHPLCSAEARSAQPRSAYSIFNHQLLAGGVQAPVSLNSPAKTKPKSNKETQNEVHEGEGVSQEVLTEPNLPAVLLSQR